MIINLRKLDYLLIAIIIVLYIITTITESVTGLTFMRYLSPILILIFVIVYLQTIRTLDQEIKRVKQLSKKEILESVNVVGEKLDESLSIDNEEYKEIKYLQLIVKIVEENLVNEIRNRTEIQATIQRVENNILEELKNRSEFQLMLKNTEDRITNDLSDKAGQINFQIDGLNAVIKMLQDLIYGAEFQLILKNTEDKIIKDLSNKVEQIYCQIDGLSSINKTLKDVNYPLPPLRGWAVSPDFTRILMKYIFDVKPGLMLEMGSGVSTIVSGYCLKMNGKGKLISLEHEEKYYQESLTNIKAHGLEDYIELYLAPLKQYVLDDVEILWYDLSKVTIDMPVDLVTVDGPPGTIQKESRYPAFPLIRPYLNHHAILLVDDYIREDEKAMVKKWMKNTQLEQVNIINTEKGTCILRYNKPE